MKRSLKKVTGDLKSKKENFISSSSRVDFRQPIIALAVRKELPCQSFSASPTGPQLDCPFHCMAFFSLLLLLPIIDFCHFFNYFSLELLKRAKLPTLHNRRLQDVAILMYKVKNDLVPGYISEIFTRKDTSYNLRNNDFEIPRFNTIRYGKHTLRYQGPYIWSKLGNSLRKLPSLSIFKTNIRRVDLVSLVEESGNCCNLCNT